MSQNRNHPGSGNRGREPIFGPRNEPRGWDGVQHRVYIAEHGPEKGQCVLRRKAEVAYLFSRD
ncbi:hypothetical protein LIA77_04115 [Sarocladium implicatum]|nr:hypothetical protein LIA77_04115 [Sarocladium implicatum]